MARSRQPQRHRAQREDIEAWLSEKGVLFTFTPDLSADDFDFDKSLRNQARINQVLNETQLETYTEAMKRGDRFPAVIAYKGQDGKYVLVDGNHRLHAAREASEPLSAYVLDGSTKPATIVQMTYEANAKHGLPNSVEDRQLHAVYLLRSGASSQENVAASLNLSKAQVQSAWAKAKADERSHRVGLLSREWDSLGPGIKARLGSVRTDEGFEAMADLAFKAQLTSKEVDQHVTEINRSRSGAEQKKTVERLKSLYRSRIQATAAGTLSPRSASKQGPKTYFYVGTGQLQALEDRIEGIVADAQLVEIPDMIKRGEEAMAIISLVVDALKAKQKGE